MSRDFLIRNSEKLTGFRDFWLLEWNLVRQLERKASLGNVHRFCKISLCSKLLGDLPKQLAVVVCHVIHFLSIDLRFNNFEPLRQLYHSCFCIARLFFKKIELFFFAVLNFYSIHIIIAPTNGGLDNEELYNRAAP